MKAALLLAVVITVHPSPSIARLESSTRLGAWRRQERGILTDLSFSMPAFDTERPNNGGEPGIHSDRLEQGPLEGPTPEIIEIIGGIPLEKDERPYLVSIGLTALIGVTPNGHNCGGTLISPNILLSAAHCFGFPFDGWVDFNTHNTAPARRVYMCANEFGQDCDTDTYAFAVVHEDYNTALFSYQDFALIFLPEPITDIEPVALNADANVPANAGDALELFGWGYTQVYPDRVFPEVPHTVTLLHVPNDECQELFSEFGPNRISSDMICAYDDGKSGCQGDSGGPLVLDSASGTVQVGVVSWGSGDCMGTPSVLARVSAGLDWINTTACQYTGEWCDECKDLEDEEDAIDTDFDVDRLPSFVQEIIDANAMSEKWDMASAAKPKKNKETMPEKQVDGVLPESIEALGSTELEPNSQPYLVSIGLKRLEGFMSPNGHFCSGTLIAPNVVLSAAYCFTDEYGNKVKLDYVEFNRHDLYADPGIVRMYIKKSDIWRHPDYNHQTYENNMALVFLPNSMVDIDPVKLNEDPSFPAVPGVDLAVFGWGALQPGGIPSNLPRTVTAGYVPNADCMNPDFAITSDMICADPNEGLGPCDYDWGSPLIQDTADGALQVGIFGTGNCRSVRAPPPKFPPCGADEKILQVDIFTDYWPWETSWELKSTCTGNPVLAVAQGEKYFDPLTLYSDEYCVPDDEYDFTIMDSASDGFCCPSGNYTVVYDGIEVAFGGDMNFTSSETTRFGNPVDVCNSESSGIYSRVSSGMDWITRTVSCKSKPSTKKELGSKSSKAGHKLSTESSEKSRSSKSGRGSKATRI